MVVGVTAADVPRHNLHLHRFHVAASGHVLGESDNGLESFWQVSPDDVAAKAFSTAFADLSNSGDKMHLICDSPQHRGPLDL
ncbi:hypothetical protein E2562_005299 [Oryza meyeriana var. granulata]|uniref:Uncharacterized protein n=1 Tax=Oryza meyeriana var. granulata TaxID=110450 RepID=A0A6G1EEV2_9ORYZ|nr:hypothetical protein E2562_005299 [Oryza meyeriana var. granulata]